MLSQVVCRLLHFQPVIPSARELGSLRLCLFPPGLWGTLLALLRKWLRPRLLLPLQLLDLLP